MRKLFRWFWDFVTWLSGEKQIEELEKTIAELKEELAAEKRRS
jgi:hypothetical protein